MAKTAKTEETLPATVGDASLPAHLQQGKTTKVGNIDASDLIIPRVKLLQGTSDEITTFDNAKSGQFWHSLAGEPLGAEISIVPIIIRKSYVLWAPRGDDRGILARARDGIHWDQPGAEFTITLKNTKRQVTYKLEETVGRLGQFGTSDPEDPQSAPAASLTYEILAAFPSRPELGLAMIINTRTAVRPCKQLISKIELRNVDHFGQVYKMGRVQEGSGGDTYWNYQYTSDGYVTDEAAFQRYGALYRQYSEMEFRAAEESDDTGGGSGGKIDTSKAPF